MNASTEQACKESHRGRAQETQQKLVNNSFIKKNSLINENIDEIGLLKCKDQKYETIKK